ncbi:MAG: hypothetical protein QG596_1275 [Actinomycetota bacterium]|jgi:uncharacterized membrane protein|nr:hypothetical protein [Actinomycetota bacterium]
MSILRRVLGLAFLGVGVLHFTRPKFFLAIMPPWIPMHKEAVAVSGAAEIAGGLAMIPDATAKPAGVWLTALLLAVFPANLHMAIDQEQIERMAKAGIPKWALYARLPLQPLLVFLVLRSSRATTGSGE